MVAGRFMPTLSYEQVAEQLFVPIIDGRRCEFTVTRSREREYPHLPGLAMDGKIHEELYQLAIRALPANSRVVDAGCGAGYGSKLMAAAGLGVTGLDCSWEAIQFARAYHGTSGRLRYELCQFGGSADLGKYDHAVSIEVVEHVDNDVGYLRQIHRALGAGGYLFLTTPLFDPQRTISPYHIREYTEDQIEALLDRAGFDFGHRIRLSGYETCQVIVAHKR